MKHTKISLFLVFILFVNTAASVPTQVHASSLDENYDQHVRVVNVLLNIARQEADEGHNVMIVIDSLTRISRVYNNRKSSGCTM